MYFVWYDGNPKKTVEKKVDEAVLRFRQKFGRSPGLVWLNPAEIVSISGLDIKGSRIVPRNHVYIDQEAA